MPRRTKAIEVRPSKGEGVGRWHARGPQRDSSYRTQREAVRAARRLAKRDQLEVVLEGRDGRIRDRSEGVCADLTTG
jgi:hypothetical protein